ncbi:MAG TPA: PP2C family protein-serine/threonine phosphatase [Thermoanaerobaculia bacterium]
MAASTRPPRAPRAVRRLDTFVRSYTKGFSSKDLQRLFDRDAASAYAVLTRDQDLGPEPKKGFRRFVYRARILFLGLSYKLSPARRVLFAVALVLALVATFPDVEWSGGERVHFSIEGSPTFFLLSLGLLVFLLALELVDRVRVRDELEVARQLQADLLPRDLAAVAGYRFAHSYRTANEVGGDYYDVTPLPDGRLALSVGDASGHGMAAGLVMAIANATLKTALDLDPAPPMVLRVMNRTLCRTGGKRTFMSLFYALLDPETGRLDYVCAGHPYPLLRRANGTVEELGCGALPLGLREPLEVPVFTARLEPGDLLLLFTDGLVEATRGEAGEAFGFERLAAVVAAGGAPQRVHDAALRAFDAHVGEEPLRDDLTLLVLGRLPE